MTQPAQAIQPGAQSAQATLFHGSVKGREGAHYFVTDESGLVRALRAASCLIDPGLGDRVLVSVAQGEAYILAVLDGPESGTRIDIAGPLTIASGTGLSLEAPRIVTKAEEGEYRFVRLSVTSLRLDATLEQAKLTIERLHTLATDILAEIGNSVRRIAGLDHVSAGQIDQQAKDTASLHGRFTSVTADKDVRIDGDQIHMG
jgi:hypothetical protein